VGWDSVLDVGTRYGVDVRGSNPGGRRDSMCYLRFSQRCCRGFRSSGTWRRVVSLSTSQETWMHA